MHSTIPLAALAILGLAMVSASADDRAETGQAASAQVAAAKKIPVYILQVSGTG